MNKILLIIQREYTSRVKKRSFLIATLIVPLVFPAIIFGMVYFAKQEKENAGPREIQLVNNSGMIELESNAQYAFEKVDLDEQVALENFKSGDAFGLLIIPAFELEKPEGITLYTKNTPGQTTVNRLENMLEDKIKDLKLEKYNVDSEVLEKLNTNVALNTLVSSEDSGEKESNTGLATGIGYFSGFLIYMFLFIYGGQVMQGVIEEKSSKIVEVIVSTVRPFHFMLGKVIGVAAVGLTQILIWVAIVGTGWTVAGTIYMDGNEKTPTEVIASTSGNEQAAEAAKELESNPKVVKLMNEVNNLPVAQIVIVFILYFLGGYLLYGALFAAVGSAVDTPADAQQFMLPIMLPIIIGFFGMSLFVTDDPHGTASVILSMIPFTSPIVMMGRMGFGVPAWELAVSILLLVGGFIGTIWVAGRIYRVGILMHGAKVNYKVLAKWFMQKN